RALSIASIHQPSTSVPHLEQITPDQFPPPQWNSVLSANFARTSPYASGTKVFRSSTALSAAALDGSASGSVGMNTNQLSDIALHPANWGDSDRHTGSATTLRGRVSGFHPRADIGRVRLADPTRDVGQRQGAPAFLLAPLQLSIDRHTHQRGGAS